MASPRDQGFSSGSRIAVITELPMYRAGVAHVLCEHYPALRIEEGSSVQNALQIAASQPVDIMLLDPSLAEEGIAIVATFSRNWPTIKLVILTTSELEQDVSRALGLGARGYLLKRASAEELLSALASVAKGEVYLSPALGARLIGRSLGTRFRQFCGTEELTRREIEILKLVSAGATNKEIACALGIREKTVKFHMTNTMEKLRVRNRVEAVVAMRDRWRASA